MTDQMLVLGATGKTGRHLVPDLVRRGVAVRAASRHPGATRAGVTPVAFDWDDPDTWSAALRGVAGVYLVGPALQTDPTALVARFLGRAADAGVTRVVHLSAWGVDQSEGPMRETEQAVEGSGLDWTILRPNWFAQNFSESFFLGGILDRGVVLAPSAGAAVSFVDTRDIAAVAAEVLTGPGHAGQGYTLSGPQPVTFAEVAAILSEVSGRPIRHEDGALESFSAYAVSQGLPTAYAGVLSALFEHVIRPGFAAPVLPVVEAVTGRPAYDFADYAASAADAWRARAA
jgi:uncharacterized protein YbjT (DUF2867 family)